MCTHSYPPRELSITKTSICITGLVLPGGFAGVGGAETFWLASTHLSVVVYMCWAITNHWHFLWQWWKMNERLVSAENRTEGELSFSLTPSFTGLVTRPVAMPVTLSCTVSYAHTRSPLPVWLWPWSSTVTYICVHPSRLWHLLVS